MDSVTDANNHLKTKIMKQIIFSFFFLIILSSCSKDNENNLLTQTRNSMLIQQRQMLPTQAEMLAELLVPVDGYVFMYSFTTLASQDLTRDAHIVGTMSYNGNKYQNLGQTQFAGIELDKRETNNYYKSDSDDLITTYGTTQQLEIEGNRKAAYQSDVYIPELIRINSPTENFNPLFEGATITWTPDEKNHRGIGILLEYGFSEEHKKFIHTEDDGSYTFTSDDIKEAMENEAKRIQISLGRGDYQRLKSSSDPNHSIGFISFSVVSAYYYPDR